MNSVLLSQQTGLPEVYDNFFTNRTLQTSELELRYSWKNQKMVRAAFAYINVHQFRCQLELGWALSRL